MKTSDFQILINFGRAVEKATSKGYSVFSHYGSENLQNDLDEIDAILSDVRKQTEQMVFEDHGSTALFLFKTNLIIFRLNDFAFIQRERIQARKIEKNQAEHLLLRLNVLFELSVQDIIPQLVLS